MSSIQPTSRERWWLRAWYSFGLWLVRRVLFRNNALLVGVTLEGCSLHARVSGAVVVPYCGYAVLCDEGQRRQRLVCADVTFLVKAEPAPSACQLN